MQIVQFKHWILELALSQTIQLVCKLRNATLGIIALKKLDGKIAKNTSCSTLVRLRSFLLCVVFVELEYIG